MVAQRRLRTQAERGAAEVVEHALAAGYALCRQFLDRDGGQLVGVGVVSPGVVLGDRIMLAPNIPGWEHLSLAQAVGAALPGIPAAFANDARAAALAELRWGRLRGVHSGLYLNVGTGLSAAVVIDGRVMAGAHQAAGEIGYARPVPGVGGPPHLEALIGGRGLGRRASLAAGHQLTAADAFAADEPVIRQVVDEAIEELGRHLANFATLLDPQRVVVGGGLMNAADLILPRLRIWLDDVVPFPPELMAGAFVTDAALHGAAAIGIDAATDATSGGLCQPSGRLVESEPR
jgi:glucokinase